MKTETVSIVIVVLFLTSITQAVTKISCVRDFSVKSNLVERTHNASVNGWAVLLEMNEFPEGWSSLPVEFINSERMQTALFSLGWQSDHVYIIHDNLNISAVQEAVEWLVNNADCDDIALLYIFTHGMWMRNVLLWNDWFPDEWQKLDTSKRILLVDTCFAEEFIEPVRTDPSPHISLACCSADEVGWAGLEEEGLPIIGSVWNHYFTNALCNLSADLNGNGFVSIEEAFNFSIPLVQGYMNETVFAVQEFLESYHDAGIYPENYDAYPHPVIDDAYPDQLVITEFPSSDTTPPTISILSPENKTYPVNDVSLTFNVSESTSWIGYSLDGQANETIVGTIIISELSDGSHSLIVYAKDAAGNTGTSETICFSIETPSPPPESFPTWVIALIVIVAVVGAVLLIYFRKGK